MLGRDFFGTFGGDVLIYIFKYTTIINKEDLGCCGLQVELKMSINDFKKLDKMPISCIHFLIDTVSYGNIITIIFLCFGFFLSVFPPFHTDEGLHFLGLDS